MTPMTITGLENIRPLSEMGCFRTKSQAIDPGDWKLPMVNGKSQLVPGPDLRFLDGIPSIFAAGLSSAREQEEMECVSFLSGTRSQGRMAQQQAGMKLAFQI